MGSFGIENFENDESLDWLEQFLERPSDKHLIKALRAPVNDIGEAQRVLAATEATAIRNGQPGENAPLLLTEWAASCRKPPAPELALLAAQRIKEVMVSRILLNEFDKSDGEIWARNQEALLVRLQCPYSPYPKRKIPKYAKPIFLTRQRRDLWPVSTFRFDRNDPSSLETQLNTGVIQVGISLDEGYSEEDFYALAKVLERFFHIKVRFFDALHSGEGRHVSQPSTIPVVEALKYFSAVHHLRLVRLTEDVTSILATFSSLVTLGIGGKGMTVDPELFNHLRQLHGLSLWQCAGIEDTQFLSGLSGLRELRLSYIDLDEIAEISKLHELERLSLGSLKLRTFPSLASLTKLRRISLMNVGSATDLAQIAEAPSLEQLLISSGPHFTEEHLKPFKDHPSLREFICAKSASNPDSAERIQRFMNLPKPNCHDWHIF